MAGLRGSGRCATQDSRQASRDFGEPGRGDPEPHMPDIAELAEPRMVTEGSPRVRKNRDDLIPLLEQLAYNLRWSWDPSTLDLFQRLAPEPWARTHNPIAAMKAAVNDPDR